MVSQKTRFGLWNFARVPAQILSADYYPPTAESNQEKDHLQSDNQAHDPLHSLPQQLSQILDFEDKQVPCCILVRNQPRGFQR